MFSNAKLCNHNIAKHTLSLQIQKNKNFTAIFLRNLKRQVIDSITKSSLKISYRKIYGTIAIFHNLGHRRDGL